MPRKGPLRTVVKAVKRIFTGSKSKKRSKPRANNIVSVSKTIQLDRDIVNMNTYQTGNITFELSDIPEYASYQALYEYFRIDKVSVTWMSLNNVSQSSGITPGTIFVAAGRLHTCIDYNDSSNFAASAAGVGEMMNDNRYKGTSSMRNQTRTLTPKILIEAGGSSTGAVSKSKQWIPTGATTAALSHYGIKFIYEGGYTDGLSYKSFVMQPIVKYWVSFKDPK